MIRINLLSEGRKPVAIKPVQAAAPTSTTEALGKWSLLGLMLLGALLAAGYYFLVRQDVAERRAEVERAREEVAELEPIIKEVEEYKTRQLELKRRVKVIKDLKAAQRGPVQIMDQISKAVPDLLWLNRMEVRSRSITLNGSAFNTNAVANFIENLDKVPEFEEPILKDTSQQREAYSFQITFNYSYATPAEESSADASGG